MSVAVNEQKVGAVVSKVPVQVWRMIIALVGSNAEGGGGRLRVRDLLMLLAVNKKIVGLAREELVKLRRLRIRCTVGQIPRAIRVFEAATEMRVVGSKTAESAESAARAALAATGTRFRVLLSDETDTESNMRWLPRRGLSLGQEDLDQLQVEEGQCVVLCDVSEKQFGEVAENVAGFYRTGRMGELVICYRGARHGLPDLSLFHSDDPVGPLRVTIENGDFDGLDDGPDGPRFRSPAVTELKLLGCDLVRLPPVWGFPNLARLEVVECFFNDYDVLSALAYAPVPPIEYLRVARCGGAHDGSPIGGLTKLQTLVMNDCTGEFPDFDEAARLALHGRIVGGELNAGGKGCLCKVIVRTLQVRKPERESAGLAMCDSDCCLPCDCGGCSDCE